ncbi:MAG: oligosaccharide flippase family protein [bacterium]
MNLKLILKNKVVKAGSWYTISNFFSRGLSFLTIPIFTRLLSTADYGVVSIYTTWVGIFTIIMTLDLKASVGRGKYDFKVDYNEFVSSVIFLSFMIFIFFLIIFNVFNDFFIQLTGLPKLLFYIMVFQAYFAFVKEYTVNKFRFEYRYKIVSIVTILMNITGITLSVFLILNVFQEQSYLGRIIGIASVTILVGIFWFFYLLVRGRTLVNREYWIYALVLSVPLVMHNVSGVINSQFDRIVINRYISDSATGIYSFAYNIGMIITVLLVSLNQAWLPWFYDQMEKQQYKNIKQKAILYRDFFTISYLLVLFIAPELVRVMSAESFWEGLFIIPWIFMAYYFQYMYTLEVNVEFYHKKTALISLGTIFSAAINVILNLILVPIYGYQAAAITTAVSYFFLFCFHYILTNKIIGHTVFGLVFHIKSLMYLMLITMLYLILRELIFVRLIVLIIISIAFFFNKKVQKLI